MKARYQLRFYPTDQQQKLLAQLFGCVRVVWNDALAMCKQAEKLPSNNDLQKLVITQAKKTIERQWLSDVSNIPLQQSVADLGVAYKNFFDSLKGKRKGKKLGRPKFKKKTNQQSARFRIGGFSIKGDEVYLAKIGNVSPIWSRDLPSAPSSVTVIKDCASRYFLSFVVEVEPVNIDAKNQSIGIDLGIKTFAVMSNGEKAQSPDYSKLDRKIRKLQKKLARQPKDSQRRNKTRIQIAKLHNEIADTRKDFLHKLSSKIVSENEVIVLEDLSVSGMVKNRKLARAISLQGWREFRTLCEAKSQKFGRTFHVISRWEPTSQICSECGYKWGKLDLKIRSVKCLNCGTEHDRDENAAKNINKVGIGHCHDSKRALQTE
ncbi:MAG: IS200/IS605 family element transposase accessory protein TnpB [Dolichospermum sp. DET50]|nr:IS200/IS605 family element transposase accessory protein TnpB [Dolichospermum sp. DET66]MBS3031968.1 IS200/IS605 family element transposase accessory protein TnpB [Dolichospermum sp. DET67]MBS3037178.1 IS200/IS605 family element transposase accessory protein TnpB [Dolichospermum sp. DET50]QSX69173.1 MAG: transposase [Dolichospermum sp. DET69]